MNTNSKIMLIFIILSMHHLMSLSDFWTSQDLFASFKVCFTTIYPIHLTLCSDASVYITERRSNFACQPEFWMWISTLWKSKIISCSHWNLHWCLCTELDELSTGKTNMTFFVFHMVHGNLIHSRIEMLLLNNLPYAFKYVQIFC